MVIRWSVLKPNTLATGMVVVPTGMALPMVEAPAVPIVSITALSRFSPVSMLILSPTEKSSTFGTLMFFAPAAEPVGRLVAGCTRKSVQLLSVSMPSGKRPALLLLAETGEDAGAKPPDEAGAGTRQPFFPVPEMAWYPSAAQGSTRTP